MRAAFGGRLFIGMAVVVVSSVTSLIGDVGAQTPGEGDSGDSIDVTVRHEEALTGPQMIAWVEENLGVVKAIYRRVQNMLDQARKEKDTLKITCLDDKLTQIRVNLKGIEERAEALRVAISAGDLVTARQQFAILKIYVARVQGLQAEAENCIGDSEIVIGQTDTVVTIDEDITIEDPSDYPEIEIAVEQPPHASGFY